MLAALRNARSMSIQQKTTPVAGFHGLDLNASHLYRASPVPARDLSRMVRTFRGAVRETSERGVELPN